MGKARSSALFSRLHISLWSSGCSWHWEALPTRSPRPRISTTTRWRASRSRRRQVATPPQPPQSPRRFRTPVFRSSVSSPSAAHWLPAGSSSGAASSARANRRSEAHSPGSPFSRGLSSRTRSYAASLSAPRATWASRSHATQLRGSVATASRYARSAPSRSPSPARRRRARCPARADQVRSACARRACIARLDPVLAHERRAPRRAPDSRRGSRPRARSGCR